MIYDSAESDLGSAFSFFVGGRAGFVPAPLLFFILRRRIGLNWPLIECWAYCENTKYLEIIRYTKTSLEHTRVWFRVSSILCNIMCGFSRKISAFTQPNRSTNIKISQGWWPNPTWWLTTEILSKIRWCPL